MAYKRELITENGKYVTSYKKHLKVSNVCQVLDKSKYPATQTINGVIFTNNGDGTITANGTATKNAMQTLTRLNIVKGHKYLILGITGGSDSTYRFLIDTVAYYYEPTISTSPKTLSTVFEIEVLSGYTISNLTFKPQLFDLTEMYGAGNEPTTVEQFRQDFPEEMYPYSPRCWVTSYKTGLIAETKNLLTEIKPFFNTKVENGIVYQGVADTRELDAFKVQLYNGDRFVKDWIYKTQQIGKNVITFTTDILPTHTRVVFGLNGLTKDTTAFAPITLENNTTYTISVDFINITQGEIAWTNSMLEKGSTATAYTPYGYL